MIFVQNFFEVYKNTKDRLNNDEIEGYILTVNTSDAVSSKSYSYKFLVSKDKTKARIIAKFSKYGKYNQKTKNNFPKEKDITSTVKKFLKSKKGIKKFYGKKEEVEGLPRSFEVAPY